MQPRPASLPLIPFILHTSLARPAALHKIEMIKLAKQKKKDREKPKSAPVVGDTQPLSDALPKLTELISESNSSMVNKSKSHAKKKPERIQCSRMKQAQKRKFIEEEVAQFKVTIENPAFKANPLAAVSEHLHKMSRKITADAGSNQRYHKMLE
ncbi:ribosome biogenesis protein SLX9 homolog [Rhinoraja longicauda]